MYETLDLLNQQTNYMVLVWFRKFSCCWMGHVWVMASQPDPEQP